MQRTQIDDNQVLEVDDFESRLEEEGLEEGETTDPAEWEIKKRSN